MEITYNNNILSKNQSDIRKSISSKVLEKEILKKESHQMKDFNFMSASLSRFLPQVPREDHWDIYIKIITTMRLREFDLTDLHKISNKLSTIKDNELFKEVDKPKIYITCHLGFCKASISLLILNGVKNIALVVDESTYKNQASTILAINDKFKNAFGLDNELKIINVEKPNTALEMMQLIKSGFSLFAYIDGNSGYKGVYNKEKTIEIPFLSSAISSRTGLSTIAYFMDIPIIPFVAYYSEDGMVPHIKFFDQLKRDNTKDIVTFTEVTTKRLYGLFEHYIEKFYDQWESWFYIHKYLPKEILAAENISLNINSLTKEDFNQGNYSVFKIDEDHYLFNRISFSVFPISQDNFNMFISFQNA